MTNQAMLSAMKGMTASSKQVENISHNIANANTTGFNAMVTIIKDDPYRTELQPGTNSPTGIQIGTGSRVAGTSRILTQGQIEVTQGDLDLAVNGRGYFQVTLPNGNTAYTRDGSFSRNENGEIVTTEGYVLNPAITIPINAVQVDINKDGEVLVKTDDAVAPQNVGQITLAKFVNANGLEAIGNNLFLETEASGAATTGVAGSPNFGMIVQGGLENSNVEVVKELTDLISAQRSYELGSKVITTSDQMMSVVAQIR